ncbi:kelch-like protein 38 isoform X2 [Oratosquilla oratoria]|uniref:kelch-like protein 38 isoform X2 n=1 Tax=Oratosquilla oratoria TaxID=337810 RepID=UPI003F770F5E
MVKSFFVAERSSLRRVTIFVQCSQKTSEKRGRKGLNLSENVLSLLQTSAMLQFPRVQKECETFITASISVDLCLEVYHTTHALGLLHIAQPALLFALWRFNDVVQSNCFLQLSIEEVTHYLSDEALNAGKEGEWKVWEAIDKWIEHDELERTEHLKKLITCLDFHRLTVNDISNILFYPVVSAQSEIVQLLEYVQRLKRTVKCIKDLNSVLEDPETEDEDVVKSIRKDAIKCLSKPSRKLPFLPCVVGFQENKKFKKKLKTSDDEDEDSISVSRRNKKLMPVVYLYNWRTKQIQVEVVLDKLYEGPVSCSGYQLCSVGPYIYVTGGEYMLGHSNWNKALWCFDKTRRKWIKEDTLPRPRRHHMVCVLDDIIYLIGGYGKYRIIQDSVDSFDTSRGRWTECPPLPQPVGSGAACAYNNQIWVFNHDTHLFKYFPGSRYWQTSTLPQCQNQNFRAALPYGDYIYLIEQCSYKVYKFCPDSEKVHVFGQFRSAPVNVCQVDGKLYSFSHDDFDDSHVIEVLDLKTEGDHPQQGQTCSSKDSSFTDSCEKSAIQEQSDLEVSQQEQCSIATTIRMSQEEWQETESGPHMFTICCPADVTFCLGCFPLLQYA